VAPTLVHTTALTAQLRWSQPEDGGCPITSFSIYSDLGYQETGFINNLEVVSVENLPYKFEHTFTFTGDETGLQLRFKLLATNEIGETYSDNYL
jgi:hypothetical protein